MAIHRYLYLALIVLFVCWAPAAEAGDVPASADPSRQSLPTAPVLAPQPLSEAPRALGGSPNLSPAVASQRFTLKSVAFTGATAFALAELQAPFQPLIGREITVAELFAILAQVQQLYLDAGYTLSRASIPQQDIAAGHVNIDVLEGYAAEVSIDPALASSPLVQEVAREITAMHPLNVHRLERLMLILAARPGLETAAVLAPMTEQNSPPGAIQVVMQKQPSKERQLHVQINNHGSNFLGPWRSDAGWREYRVFGSDADVGFALGATPGSNELRQASLEVAAPLFGASGTMLRATAGRTLTFPGENLKTLDVKGASNSLGIQIDHPLILQRDKRLSIGAAFDYQNIATDLLQDRIFDDRLRTATLSGNYSFYDDWAGSNTLDLFYRQGFDILGPRTDAANNLSRVEGKSTFKKIAGSINRVQPIASGVDVLAAVEGQYAWDPLLSAEEFGYGGSDVGRAYDASELVGDRGIAAIVELRYTVQPTWLSETILQPHAFYDIGKVWNIDPSARDKASASSGGLGVRFVLPQGTSGSLSAAVPLTRPIDAPPNYADEDGPRILFSLRQDF